MRKKQIFTGVLTLSLLLSGCAGQNNNNSTSKETTVTGTEDNVTETGAAEADMFTARDYEAGYESAKSAVIYLSKSSASCSSDAVSISDNIITIIDEGTYILEGELDDGMIIVDADDTDKVQLVLNGVAINSETSAAVYVLDADKVFVTLNEGTVNTLSNGGSFTAIDENNIDSVVFSKQDLSFNGSGSIEIISPAGHGIVCKDDLVFTSGTYAINAAAHGCDANDSVRITNALLTITAGKDGIHAENNDDTDKGFVYIADGAFNITAEGDGISAGAYMQIEDGTFGITAKSSGAEQTDDSSTSIKGIKAGGNLVINSGAFNINTEDDAFHSNASVTINGGEYEIVSGDDAFHSDETLTFTGGTVNVNESYEGLEGLHIFITGGDINITASDDGINAAGGKDESGFGGPGGGMQRDRGMQSSSSSETGSITISGGNITVHASGDGIDANGTLTVSGGTTIVSGPVSGDTSVLDYDISGEITGGVFIGTGAYVMAQTFDKSSQGVISVNSGDYPAGTMITLTNADQNIIMSYETDQSFAVIILSSPDIIKGEKYTITVGDTTGEFTAS